MARATLICKLPPGSGRRSTSTRRRSRSAARRTSPSGRTRARPAPARAAPAASCAAAASPSITISNIVLQGEDTKSRCDQLLDWMNPGGGLLARLAGAALSAATGGAINLATSMPQLTFMWGPPAVGVHVRVQARDRPTSSTSGSIRPASRLAPTCRSRCRSSRACSARLPTNPTSGGLPGRHIHLVSDGENLQTISTATYGVSGVLARRSPTATASTTRHAFAAGHEVVPAEPGRAARRERVARWSSLDIGGCRQSRRARLQPFAPRSRVGMLGMGAAAASRRRRRSCNGSSSTRTCTFPTCSRSRSSTSRAASSTTPG